MYEDCLNNEEISDNIEENSENLDEYREISDTIEEISDIMDQQKSETLGENALKKARRSGSGKECPECHKVVGNLKGHMEDIHSPPGHFPCPGCDKVFTSKNRQMSHYYRHCKKKEEILEEKNIRRKIN